MTQQKSSRRKTLRVSDEAVREMILAMCHAAYPDIRVRPEDIAMELNPMDWQTLLKRIRLIAKQLMEMGEIDILRKGKPISDPVDAKGVIRYRLRPRDEKE